MTYEEILKRELDSIPNVYDKRKDSMMYLALAPCAYEMAMIYKGIENIYEGFFADKAGDIILDRICADRGIRRKLATYAVRLGEFDIDVPLGMRLGVGSITYTVTKILSGHKAELTCEQAGKVGNQHHGDILPLSYLAGLGKAELTDIITPGVDKESDDSLRERFFLYVQKPVSSGNIHQYRQWALEVPGIGEAKVFPLWYGAGTVKVVVADQNKLAPSAELIENVKMHIEDVRPIGASVTIVAPTPKIINISVTVSLGKDVFLNDVQNNFKASIITYLADIALKKNAVSYAITGSLLLEVPGVLDYTNLLLNGTSVNVVLREEEIPVLGTVNIGVEV